MNGLESYLHSVFTDPFSGKIIASVIGIAIILGLFRIVRKNIPRYIKEPDNRYRFRKIFSFLGYLAALLYLSVVFSDKLGGLTVAFGVAGAGIAFALQEVIASFAGWIAISTGGFYKTSDRVQLGGIKGDVIDIGLLRTTLMEIGQWVNGDLYNGRVVRIANSFVFKEPVFNYSADFPFLWDEIVLPVRYGSDVKAARTMLSGIAADVVGQYAAHARQFWTDMVKKYMIENANIEPTVTMIANDNWIEFTLRYVVDYKSRRSTKDLLFTKILEQIDRSKGTIALASATYELVAAPRLSVDIATPARKRK